MNWKDFFYFSKKERTGLLLLIIFIAGVAVGKWFFTPNKPEPIDEAVLLATNSSAVTDSIPNREGKATHYNQSKPKQNLKPVSKTYYMQEQSQIERPAPTYQRSEKYPEGTVICLNSADTTELKKIPGIGSSYAKRIAGYRNLLGGYYHLEQLQEVYGMYVELYEGIIPYLHIDTTLLQQISVNSVSLDKLKAHPYIDFYQAKAIIEFRKKRGKINHIEELSLLEEFTEEDWERIAPYLHFE